MTIEPSDAQDDFAACLEQSIGEGYQDAKSIDPVGTWRKPHWTNTAHYVMEWWEAQFFAPCRVWFSMIGSKVDDGAPKCPLCVKALEAKGNE